MQFLTDFSLRMPISAIFYLGIIGRNMAVEVLLTDSESQTPISYSSLIVTIVISQIEPYMALCGLVFEIRARNKQTTDDDRQTTLLLNVSHMLLQAGHLTRVTRHCRQWRDLLTDM